MTPQHVAHRADELCDAGSALYARALREGRVPNEDADQAPCLVDLGLLHPDVDDMRWLRPTAPNIALPRLLGGIEERIAGQRRREERLTAAFQPLMALDAQLTSESGDDPAITVLDGPERINAAMDRATRETTEEFLAVQPVGPCPTETPGGPRTRAQTLLARGVRLRMLYRHAPLDSLPMPAHYERLDGDSESRALEEVTERLLVFDRTAAFVPASKDGTLALELRHPALVEYFATTFWRLWRLATPMYPQPALQPTENGITSRQHAVAGLLVEGLTDAEIADRLGLNIRTARVHIAKLAATLGSSSRAQLGYLIGESGVLGQGR
ncbi:helix-turn-helix transcriptional regulator [Streptomyces sp. NPDC093510]|uniref:helix-turn-helix transcriptional regulator n=1 Tax=Streptomyces sp. NPDC093510 TaxID=3155199 RepID=UPI0034216850